MVETVPYFDLRGQFAAYKDAWFAQIETLGQRGQFILGDAVAELEERVAEYFGTRYAVTVSSGTDALVIALKSVGVQPGDSVIIPNFTFFATAEAVTLAGAIPKFVDISPHHFNLDPSQIAAAIDETTKAIVPVHLFGCPAQIEQICQIADTHHLKVVEDAAQAFGARIGNRRIGQFGAAGCFSFFPTKILGAFGDGGLIVTDDEEVCEAARRYRSHGTAGPNLHDRVGYTARLDPVQAVLIQLKLENIDGFIQARQAYRDVYCNELRDLCRTPEACGAGEHVYNVFTIQTEKRGALETALKHHQIGYQIYYPHAIHQQSPYQSLGYQDADFPVTCKTCETVLSLPLYHDMPQAHIKRVIEVVQDALA